MNSRRDTKALLLQTAIDLLWSHSYGSISVDDICRKAKAKKGSFYHYFESKAELAKAALEHLWEEIRPGLDQTFSPQVPPLERVRTYALAAYREQAELKERLGYIVGCPFTAIGSEQCAADDGLSEKSREILERVTKYLKSAIQDGVTEGSIPPQDAALSAARILTYEIGALSLARVSNSLTPLEGLDEICLRMLGVVGAATRDERAKAAA